MRETLFSPSRTLKTHHGHHTGNFFCPRPLEYPRAWGGDPPLFRCDAQHPCAMNRPIFVNFRWRLKTGARCCGDSFTRPRASSLDSDRPQPNTRLSRLELVERHDHTRSRAITRQGSARQPIRAACPPSAAVWGDAKLVHPLFMKILFALPHRLTPRHPRKPYVYPVNLYRGLYPRDRNSALNKGTPSLPDHHPDAPTPTPPSVRLPRAMPCYGTPRVCAYSSALLWADLPS